LGNSQKEQSTKSARAYTKIELNQPTSDKRKKGEANQRKGAAALGAQKKKPQKPPSQGKRGGPKPVVSREQKPGKTSPKKNKVAEKAVRIIPLGGLEEIGKNITLIEYENDILIIDCGLGFPDNELLGIDIVIPDFSYVVENKEKLRGLLVTHGHEDHIGSVPYLLKQVDIPVFGTKLTLGLIEARLREHGMTANLNVVKPGELNTFGVFSVEAVHVNHSIPDSVAFSINTPAGVIVHTGDFKIDYTPIVDEVIDLRRFGELGINGVALLLSDSTNAERFGNSVSERVVGEGFERLFSRAEGKRVVIASFASNIQRIQQIIDLAGRHGRKVAISGRSMENYFEMAAKLGYLQFNNDILIDISEVNRYEPREIIIVTTGSQGEPMSALTRMANGMHRQISITSNDFVIISATPVPGNERTVTKVINELMKLGSEVIYESMYEVHASGHACRDDLKLMLNLTKPKFFIPVHGEYKHLVRHKEIALSMGVAPENVLIPAIGLPIELTKEGVRYAQPVTSGRVLVDGLGVGDVGSVVLRDRKHLSQDGLIVAVCIIDEQTNELMSGPDLISRGFVFVRESEELLAEAKTLVRDILLANSGNSKRAKDDIRLEIREELGKLMYRKTKRNPMILPIIMDV